MKLYTRVEKPGNTVIAAYKTPMVIMSTKKLITIFKRLKIPDHTTNSEKMVTNQPPKKGEIGMRLLIKIPAAEATDPIEIVVEIN